MDGEGGSSRSLRVGDEVYSKKKNKRGLVEEIVDSEQVVVSWHGEERKRRKGVSMKYLQLASEKQPVPVSFWAHCALTERQQEGVKAAVVLSIKWDDGPTATDELVKHGLTLGQLAHADSKWSVRNSYAMGIERKYVCVYVYTEF